MPKIAINEQILVYIQNIPTLLLMITTLDSDNILLTELNILLSNVTSKLFPARR